MKKLRRQTSVVIVIVIALSLITPIRAIAVDVGGKEITSRGACVLDFETGITLFGYNEDAQRVPASMTKLIAVYVVYDAISAGEISFDTVTKISQGVSALSNNWEYSNVPFTPGMSVTIRELLDVVIVWSACGATVALGEAVCGSESALVARMNAKVASLGIDAVFYDCYGVSANNRISPSGMAKLARNIILDHPEILEVTSKRSVTFRGTEYKNTNLLLGDYSGIDGVKTGYTDAAGYCFTGTARRDGRRIIAVTMGSTAVSRFPDARVLLDYGFAVADSVIAEYNSIGEADEAANDFENDAANDGVNDADNVDVNDIDNNAANGADNNTANNIDNNAANDAAIKTVYDTALPSGANLILDGNVMPLNAYNIGGNHFFKLRDIAFLLRDTECRFDVTWEKSMKAVIMTTGLYYPYTGNIQGDIGAEARKCSPSSQRFFLDGEEHMLDAYLIDGNNYFRLRDFGLLFGFYVDWVGETRTVVINTLVGAEDAEFENGESENIDSGDNEAEYVEPQTADFENIGFEAAA